MAKTPVFPFIIIRCYGTGLANDGFLNILFESQKKYPGLVNEIWFAGGSFNGLEDAERECREILPYREICRDLDIAFSFQQGSTMGHSHTPAVADNLPQSAWTMDTDGVRYPGVICPLAPEAQEYFYRSCRIFMETLQPESYYLDDDFRMAHKLGTVCCCDRCMERFNKEHNSTFTRETLKAALKSTDRQTALDIRSKWTKFNQNRLTELIALCRKAADEAAPECRLGLQVISSSWVYDGEDFYSQLAALSGKERKKVGIRPGALYFADSIPRDIIRKALDMLKESARCAKYGFVGQVCAEVENYPHISASKNPVGLLNECAVMLANGVDSLAIYWGSDVNRESDDNYRFFFEMLNSYKPFLLKVRETFTGSVPSGIALYRGSEKLAHPQWEIEGFDTESRLAENGVPITRMAAHPEVWVLDKRCVEEFGAADIHECFSKTVLMDTEAFLEMCRRFPEWEGGEMVKITPAAEPAFEVFDGKYKAGDFKYVIEKNSPQVELISGVSNMENAGGSCVITLNNGSRIILIQQLASRWLWTEYRRKMILDALDKFHDKGGMSVRLMTGGFAVWTVSRTDDSGRTCGAFLYNLAPGRTVPLQIAIRRPVSEDCYLHWPESEPVKLQVLSRSEDEIILQLPAMQSFQVMLISCRRQHKFHKK